jgi:hypothetical protein
MIIFNFPQLFAFYCLSLCFTILEISVPLVWSFATVGGQTKLSFYILDRYSSVLFQSPSAPCTKDGRKNNPKPQISTTLLF